MTDCHLGNSSSGLWADIARAVLAGDEPAAIQARWIAQGLPADVVNEHLVSVLQNPMLAIAKRLTVALSCREWMNRQYAYLDQFTDLVPTCRDLGPDEFLSRFAIPNRAVMLPGAADGWPALQKWTNSFLADVCGGELVNVMINRDGAEPEDQYTGSRLVRQMTVTEFVALLDRSGPTNDFYLVAKNGFFTSGRTRALLEDVGTLSVMASPPKPEDVRLWFGPQGTFTPLHHDSRSTCLVQIRGRKAFTLIAPWYAAEMHQESCGYAARTVRKSSVRRRAEFVLNPGDVLFVPVGWWHEVEALDVSISLSLLDVGIPAPGARA